MSTGIGNPYRLDGMKRKYEDTKPSHPLHSQHFKLSHDTKNDTKFVKAISPSLVIVHDAKRARMLPFQTVPMKKDGMDILNQALKYISMGDRQLCSSNLREFSTDHLATLDSSKYDMALETLIEIAKISKQNDIGRVTLRFVYSILERSSNDIFARTVFHMLKDQESETSLFSRLFLDAPVLGILEMSVRRGLVRDLESLGPKIAEVIHRCYRSQLDPLKRCASIKMQISLGTRNTSSPSTISFIERMLCDSTGDRDVRVRMIALEGLTEMAPKLLTINAYSVIKELTRDTMSCVRLSSLRIIQVFAQRFPMHELRVPSSSSSSSSTIYLCDDAFSTICDAINDMEIEVRSVAASLLGEFTHVSQSFLDQTLDKKMMKMQTTDKGAKIGIRTTESFFSIRKVEKKRDITEWSSGKLLNEVAPGERKDGKTNEDDDSIIPHGACGAFITALEDEFMSVRKAAVYSLGKLASTRPAFAASALDHLADMFNDEIEEVRLDSILALTPLVRRGELFKEQLETIIKCLDDATPVSRNALRKLLCKAQFADVDCVRICVRSLLSCMKRYPMDKMDIYETMAQLGLSHSSLVHAIVTELLQLHPVFASQEKPLQDEIYMAKLIMVLNAASQFEPIVSLLPPYALKHFRYMRCGMPHLVPVIPTIAGREKGMAEKRLIELRDKWAGPRVQVLEEVYSRLVDIESTKDSSTRSNLRHYIVEDLEAICSLNISLASPSRLAISLASCLSSFDRICNECIGSMNELNDIYAVIDKELWLVLCIEERFSLLSTEVLSFLIEARFHLLMYRSLATLSLRSIQYKETLASIRYEMEEIERKFISAKAKPSSNMTKVFTSLESLLSSGKFLTPGGLSELLLMNQPKLPSTITNMDKVRVKWAEIIEPESELLMEKPLKFVSILPTCILFVADIHELSDNDIDRIRIQIDYPDRSRVLFRPRSSEINRMNDTTIRIRSNVLLAASSAWSESADVRLTLVISSSSNLESIPLSSSPSHSLPSSILIKMQPLIRAGGQQQQLYHGGGIPREGVIGL